MLENHGGSIQGYWEYTSVSAKTGGNKKFLVTRIERQLLYRSNITNLSVILADTAHLSGLTAFTNTSAVFSDSCADVVGGDLMLVM